MIQIKKGGILKTPYFRISGIHAGPREEVNGIKTGTT
jgi:hypothetical protein